VHNTCTKASTPEIRNYGSHYAPGNNNCQIEQLKEVEAPQLHIKVATSKNDPRTDPIDAILLGALPVFGPAPF